MVKDQRGMWLPTCAGKAAGCAMAGPPWIAASAQSHLGCTSRTVAPPVGTTAKPANIPPIDQLRATTSSIHRQLPAPVAGKLKPDKMNWYLFGFLGRPTRVHMASAAHCPFPSRIHEEY
eukprot:scaffold104224_cov18-Prasinocladus_malaysianus.AAC.1